MLMITLLCSDASEEKTNTTVSTINSNCINATCHFLAPPAEAMSRLLPSTGIASNDTRHSSASTIDLITTSSPIGLSAYSKFAQTNDKNSFAPSPFLGHISEIKTYPQGVSIGEVLPDTLGGGHFSRPKHAYFGGHRPVVLHSDIQVDAGKSNSPSVPEVKQDKYHHLVADTSFSTKDIKLHAQTHDTRDEESPLLHLLQENSQLKQGEYRSPEISSTYNLKDVLDFQKQQEIRGKPDTLFHQVDDNIELKQGSYRPTNEPSFALKELKDYRQNHFETRDKPDSFFEGLDASHFFKGSDYKQSSEQFFKFPSDYKGEGYTYERPLGSLGLVDTNILPEYHQTVFQLPGTIKPIKEESYDDPKYTPYPPAKSTYGLISHDGPHVYNKHVEIHDEGSNKWKSVFRFLATAIPFGLLVAALSPNLLVINSTESPEEPGKSKYRSLEGIVPQLKDSFLDEDQLDSCQKRKLCDAIVAAGSAKFQPYIRQIAKKSKGSSLADVFGKASKNKCSEFNCT